MNIKVFNGNNSPQNYYYQDKKTRLRNAFENNILTDIKLPKT